MIPLIHGLFLFDHSKNVIDVLFIYLIKVAIQTVYLEITAMNHVLATVKPTRVIYRMDHVFSVSLDGQELHVTQVYVFIIN